MMKHEVITAHIQENIQSGSLAPNGRLPSLREMAEAFGVSIGTVQVAYNKLEKENFIYSLPKKGHFVLGAGDVPAGKPQQLIDFYSGSPDARYVPAHDMRQCMHKAINLYQPSMYAYTNPQGLDDLLAVMQAHLAEYQVHAKTENIMMVSGSQLVLDILCRMPFPNRKDKVLVEQPAYYGLIKSLDINRTPRVGVRRGFGKLDFDELERLFRYDSIKFFYTVPRYHNPTGDSYTRKEMKAIVELAEKYNVYIVEDDIAADYDTCTKNDPLHFYDIHDKVIYIKSFSKILMPGLRMAAVVLPKLLVNTFSSYHQWTDTSCPTICQGALAIYLGGGMFQKHRKIIRELYKKRMATLKKIAEKTAVPCIEWSIPDSGFFACLKVQGGVPFDLIQPGLVKNNIRMMDTRLFFLDEFRSNEYFRISISKANEDEIESGVTQLIELLQSHRSPRHTAKGHFLNATRQDVDISSMLSS